MRMHAASLLVAAGAALLLACGTPTWSQAPSANKARIHVMVQFTDATLHPSEAHVLPGGNVSWINYSTLYVASIFISTSTANALGCAHMRPLFTEVAGGYQSAAIEQDSDDVELPCAPPAGRYEYELRLSDSLDGVDDPQSTMKGSIVVGPAR